MRTLFKLAKGLDTTASTIIIEVEEALKAAGDELSSAP